MGFFWCGAQRCILGIVFLQEWWVGPESLFCCVVPCGALLNLKRCFPWPKICLWHWINTETSNRFRVIPSGASSLSTGWVRSHAWAITAYLILTTVTLQCLSHHQVSVLCLMWFVCKCPSCFSHIFVTVVNTSSTPGTKIRRYQKRSTKLMNKSVCVSTHFCAFFPE